MNILDTREPGPRERPDTPPSTRRGLAALTVPIDEVA
jgi:hypothetical protein